MTTEAGLASMEDSMSKAHEATTATTTVEDPSGDLRYPDTVDDRRRKKNTIYDQSLNLLMSRP